MDQPVEARNPPNAPAPAPSSSYWSLAVRIFLVLGGNPVQAPHPETQCRIGKRCGGACIPANHECRLSTTASTQACGAGYVTVGKTCRAVPPPVATAVAAAPPPPPPDASPVPPTVPQATVPQSGYTYSGTGAQVPSGGTASGSPGVAVRGYTRSNGTVVEGYTRSAPGQGSGRGHR